MTPDSYFYLALDCSYLLGIGPQPAPDNPYMSSIALAKSIRLNQYKNKKTLALHQKKQP